MKKRILFVDDMKEVYEILKHDLERKYEVDYAQTEEQALEMIRAKNYDEVLTDYHLGKNSPKGGLEVVKVAKEKGLEVTLMSTQNHRQEALELGAEFLFKKEVIKNV